MSQPVVEQKARWSFARVKKVSSILLISGVLILLAWLAVVLRKRQAAIHRVTLMQTETIDQLSFQDATLEEVLATMRKFWDARHPQDPFPVRLTPDLLEASRQASLQSRISVDLRNVAYTDALFYIASLCGLKAKETKGIFIVQPASTAEGPITTEFSVSPSSIKALGVTVPPGADVVEMKEAFERQGIRFGLRTAAVYLPKSGKLIVRANEGEMEKVKEIVEKVSSPFWFWR